jgi:hypothetical protein
MTDMQGCLRKQTKATTLMQLHRGCQQHIFGVSWHAAGVEDQLKTNYQLYTAKPGAAGGAYVDGHAGAGLQLLHTRLYSSPDGLERTARKGYKMKPVRMLAAIGLSFRACRLGSW